MLQEKLNAEMLDIKQFKRATVEDFPSLGNDTLHNRDILNTIHKSPEQVIRLKRTTMGGPQCHDTSLKVTIETFIPHAEMWAQVGANKFVLSTESNTYAWVSQYQDITSIDTAYSYTLILARFVKTYDDLTQVHFTSEDEFFVLGYEGSVNGTISCIGPDLPEYVEVFPGNLIALSNRCTLITTKFVAKQFPTFDWKYENLYPYYEQNLPSIGFTINRTEKTSAQYVSGKINEITKDIMENEHKFTEYLGKVQKAAETKTYFSVTNSVGINSLFTDEYR